MKERIQSKEKDDNKRNEEHRNYMRFEERDKMIIKERIQSEWKRER